MYIYMYIYIYVYIYVYIYGFQYDYIYQLRSVGSSHPRSGEITRPSPALSKASSTKPSKASPGATCQIRRNGGKYVIQQLQIDLYQQISNHDCQYSPPIFLFSYRCDTGEASIQVGCILFNNYLLSVHNPIPLIFNTFERSQRCVNPQEIFRTCS